VGLFPIFLSVGNAYPFALISSFLTQRRKNPLSYAVTTITHETIEANTDYSLKVVIIL